MLFRRLFGGSCKDSRAKHNQPNAITGAGSYFTQTFASIAAAGLVIASAGFGAVYAWTAGSPHGALMASLMVVMAVALELAKPLAVASAFAAFRSWALARGVALALLASVAVTYSLTAEVTLMAMARGDLVAERAAATKLAKSTDGQRGRIEGELAQLASTRPAATIRAEIAGMLADNRIGDCSIMDGPRSKAACPTVNRLRAELGNAERRDKLDVDLAALLPAKPTDGATDKRADPGAHALSVYLSAMGLSVPAGLLTDWLTLVPVLALEIGAALSALLMQTVSGTLNPPRENVSAASQRADTIGQDTPARSESASPDAKSLGHPGSAASGATRRNSPKRTPSKGPKRARRKRGKDSGGSDGGGQQGKRRLGNVVDLLKARGGRIESGQRDLAKSLGLSKSRVNEVLHELATAGVLRVATSRTGTMISLAAA
jgi:hypothetical protein